MRIDELIKRYRKANGISIRLALADYNTLYDAMKPNNRYTVKVHGYLVHAYWRRKPMSSHKIRQNKNRLSRLMAKTVLIPHMKKFRRA